MKIPEATGSHGEYHCGPFKVLEDGNGAWVERDGKHAFKLPSVREGLALVRAIVRWADSYDTAELAEAGLLKVRKAKE
jgi:hypothetical protein